jgi:hypothetical protein
MDINELIAFIENEARRFGAITDQNDPNRSYILRNNARDGYSDENKAYVGLVQPDELPSGQYHDFSFTVMPGTNSLPWLVTICVGSLGFKNDYELAAFPGLRRFFAPLVDGNGICKSDFSDIETPLPKEFVKRAELAHLKRTVTEYSKVFSVCQIVKDPFTEEGKKIISAILAGYARFRDWPSNKDHDDAISHALSLRTTNQSADPEAEIEQLVKERRFVVLQGSPGTGKTRAAKEICTRIGATPIFIQFHAETTYSDFVWGIRPSLNDEKVRYREQKGALVKAIENAQKDKTLLIIDEINRANLANVLGPVFYLFEYQMQKSDVEVEVTPELRVCALPENLYVIATMNTADRSLAVVDFALRRRFAWYTLRPRPIVNPDRGKFFKKDFEALDQIFRWFATSDELSLQPGQGYFIADDDVQMTNRITYEIYPLIREYLQEGLMRTAKESFNEYFTNRIKKSLFE